MDMRLGIQSAYSLLYGVHKPEILLDRLSTLGVQTVSISDRNNLYGVHSFLEAARERNIRPIIGVTLTCSDKSRVYCFVQDRAGFSRLCEILTFRNKEKDKDSFDPLLYLIEIL